VCWIRNRYTVDEVVYMAYETLGGLGAFFAAFLILGIFMVVAVYVYFAFVFSTLAKKMGQKDLMWLAWVPIAQFALLPILAKKRWEWAFILLAPIVNIVFMVMWTWKIFEARKYPGWLSLLCVFTIMPFVGWIAAIADLVVWGLVAWSDK
jgi:hypothetical protein